jgi:hypothetical protein
VIVLAWLASTQVIASQTVVDVAALDVTTAKALGGADMWGGASGAKMELIVVDVVTIREADMACQVQMCCSGLALETEQPRASPSSCG